MPKANARRRRAERAARAVLNAVGIAVCAWVVMLWWGVLADLRDEPSIAHPYWAAVTMTLVLWIAFSLGAAAWRRLRKRGGRRG